MDGGDGGSVRSVSTGRNGTQKDDRFFGMVQPLNGVNYCDIDFGFSDDPSQDYQDRSGGQRMTPSHPTLCLPGELSAMPSVSAPPDNGFSEGCPARISCFLSFRGKPIHPGARGDETERMDSLDWNESSGNQDVPREVGARPPR